MSVSGFGSGSMDYEGNIFISYSSQDIVTRTFLQERLSEKYPNIWSDASFRGSEQWWHEILDRIAECEIFVFLLSPDSISSLYCRAEYAEALRLHKPILPITIRSGSYIPNIIRNHQIVDVTKDRSTLAILSTVLAGIDRAYERRDTFIKEPLWEARRNLPNALIQIRVLASLDPQYNEGKLNSGIFLYSGDKVNITASGNISFDPQRHFTDPNGIHVDNTGRQIDFPNSQAYRTRNPARPNSKDIGYVGSLIGWIGDGGFADNRRAFYIGDRSEFTVPDLESGFLYLAINDAAGTYGDNTGHFEARIIISR